MTEWLDSATGGLLARVVPGTGPVLALAIHAGHEAPRDLTALFALTDAERTREEDPFTASFAPEGVTLVEVVRTRFEVDLNRPRTSCVYERPEDAWGLTVTAEPLPAPLAERARTVWDDFHDRLAETVRAMLEEHGRIVVLDLHSYNHRRGGAGAPAADPAMNPEVNLGTERIDRDLWTPVVDGFIGSMVESGFQVAENVKFTGGHLSGWLGELAPGRVCPLAIEFKKTFMDEWTGEAQGPAVQRIKEALGLALPALVNGLERTPPR